MNVQFCQYVIFVWQCLTCVRVWCVWQMTLSLNDGLWGINETFPLLTSSSHKTKQGRSECQTALLYECKSRHVCDGWCLELQTGGKSFWTHSCWLSVFSYDITHYRANGWPRRVNTQNPFQSSVKTLQGTTVGSVVHWWYGVVSPPQLTCCYSDANAMDRLERALFLTGDTYICDRVTCRFVKLNPPLMLSEG